jgi:hypothetical protein
MYDEPRQLPLFIIVEEAEIGAGTVLITRWIVWWDGQTQLLDTYYIAGG